MTEKSKECAVCKKELLFDRYEGDWAVWECSNCGSESQEPAGGANDSGFTMESLGRVSDYIESED